MTPQTKQLHALLFTSSKGMDIQAIKDICSLSDAEFDTSKTELATFLDETGIELIEHKNQLQLGVRSSALPKKLADQKTTENLSSAGLEVLAIIAYRQPISRAEIEELRGVGAQQSLRGLLEKELIDQKKTMKASITHISYVTTNRFLHHMGLKSIDNLPKMKAKL